MKNVLFALILGISVAACGADGKSRNDLAPASDPSKPVGSTGAAGPAGPAEPAKTPADAQRASAGAAAEPAPAPAPDTTAAEDAAPASSAAPEPKPPEPAAEYREITVPAGTVLPLRLTTGVGSDTSNVEDSVQATLRNAIVIRGTQVIPAGTAVAGHVTAAERSARVKGRARVAFRFNRLDLPGEGGRHAISTGTVARVAPGTKKQDATKIGAGAAGGAIIGGILGGGKGAAKGAAIGGGAGTGVVVATRGKEVRLAAGTPVSVKLTSPLTVRVRVR